MHYNRRTISMLLIKEISMKKVNTLHKQMQLPSKEDRHKLFGSVEPGPRTKPETKAEMADLQNSKEDFLFAINAVGISNVKYPIVVASELSPQMQTSIGTFKMTSTIDQMSKGTNMSRFLEQIEQSNSGGLHVDFPSLYTFALELKRRLKHENSFVEVEYPWFYERKGPKSNLAGLNHATITSKTEVLADDSAVYTGKLHAKITTLCPCSKEISEYSAHSQRGNVTITVTFNDSFNPEEIDWKRDLLEAAESNASAMIHPVLKRVDEKSVTEQAYENPRFVEDVVRLVAADLYEIPYVQSFTVVCENEESIHLHDAIAEIHYDKSNL